MCPARRITSPIIARGGDIQSLNLPLASFMQRQDVVLSALDHAGPPSGSFGSIPISALQRYGMLWSTAGHSLYRDDDHLGGAGVDLVPPEFGPIPEAEVGSVETAQTGRRH